MDVTVDVILTVNGGDEVSRAVADSPALLGFETSRYRPPEDLSVDFCDWPFTDPEATFDDHLDVVAEERPKYAVAPDVEGEYDLQTVLSLAYELDKYAEHVIIVPKDCEPSAIPEQFRIGYPNQPAFGSNGNWWRSAYPDGRPAHVLGGSPDDQLDVRNYLTVGSVDGANVTRYAEYGRVWTPGRQLERPDISYYERVRESLANLHSMWNMARSSEPPESELEDSAQTTLVQTDGGRNHCNIEPETDHSEGRAMSERDDGELDQNGNCTNDSERWSLERLIQYAKTLDRGREYQNSQERIRKRKLAFGARKWARTKQSRQAGTDDSEENHD